MQDQVMPKENWEFDKEVSNCFQDMLERSIPQYEVMRQLTLEMAKPFVGHQTDIVDIGCSNGLSLEKFVSFFGVPNRYIGLEISDPMIEQARERFNGYINLKPKIVDIQKHDLRNGLPQITPSVILSILTIQFIPIEYRLKIIQDIYDKLLHGGCFIFIEKVIGNSAHIDSLLTNNYYELKQKNGYTAEQIIRKKESLEGVLVPVTAKWNEEMLSMAGFRQIDCFWRYLNFAGWIAIK